MCCSSVNRLGETMGIPQNNSTSTDHSELIFHILDKTFFFLKTKVQKLA